MRSRIQDSWLQLSSPDSQLQCHSLRRCWLDRIGDSSTAWCYSCLSFNNLRFFLSLRQLSTSRSAAALRHFPTGRRHSLQLFICAIMATVQQHKSTPTGSMRSSRSPAPKPKSFTPSTKSKDYRSEGVQDNDIFLLPASNFQLLGVLTVVAAVVRLFRIYQPSSVVFDEVQ